MAAHVRSVIGRPVRLLMLAVAAGSAGVFAFAADRPQEGQIKRAQKSVVGIVCSGRTASGFIWPQSDKVVTALHAVTGCPRLNVRYEELGLSRPGRTIAVLATADLALIQVEDAPQLPPLTLSDRYLPYGEELVVIGYVAGQASKSPCPLHVQKGSKPLFDIATDEIRRELGSIKVPSLDLEVVQIFGHLQYGLSGAPILDSSGAVVGVGDGGLGGGTQSLSWAIRAAEVKQLPNSKDEVAIVGNRRYEHSKSLFVADLGAMEQARQKNGAQGQALTCGKLSFEKSRTATFEELVKWSDDPVGLTQVWSAFQFSPSSAPGQTSPFDVYSNRESGATIVLPADAEMSLTTKDGVCVLEEYNAATRVFIASGIGSDVLTTLRSLEGSVERDLLADPDFRYQAPHARFDGLTVFRAGYFAMVPERTRTGGYAFATAVQRNGVFVIVLAVNYVLDPRVIPACQASPGLPTCLLFPQALKRWPFYLLAVHLSTFAIG